MFGFIFLLFFISFLISLFLIIFLLKISEKGKFFDIPWGDALKIHKLPVSYLGGLAMILSAIAGLVLASFFYKNFYLQIVGIILSAAVIFLLGFWDDLRWKHISKIKPCRKFLFLIILSLLASIFLMFGGLRISFFSNIYLGIFTNIRRILRKKSIFLGDRSHFYDRLLQKGFSAQKTLFVFYSIQFLFVAAGVIITAITL